MENKVMAGMHADSQTRLTDFSEILQASSYTVETRLLKFREKSGVPIHTWTPSTLGVEAKAQGLKVNLSSRLVCT